jgi:integrase
MADACCFAAPTSTATSGAKFRRLALSRLLASKLEKTRHPGIYKRGGRYVFQYRDEQNKQRWETRRTLDAALRAKRARETDVERGEHQEIARVDFAAYASEWVESYQGRGRSGFREETRAEYRSMLESYAIPYFGGSLRRQLGRVTPRDVAGFIAWLCDPAEQGGRRLSDSRVRNILNPVRSLFATAVERGDVRTNPARDARLPHRAKIDEDDDRPRPFPADAIDRVIAALPEEHRLMFELLAATGLRRSELIGLEGRHLQLGGDTPHVRVRQRVRRRGKEGLIVGPLKSRYARRDLPIPGALVARLRALRVADREFVFATSAGTAHDPDNLFKRVLRPACDAAEVPWAGFHTFRHTVASMLFAQGRNVVQVQRWLGHHAPSFTLDTYVHLLEDDLGDPLE